MTERSEGRAQRDCGVKQSATPIERDSIEKIVAAARTTAEQIGRSGIAGYGNAVTDIADRIEALQQQAEPAARLPDDAADTAVWALIKAAETCGAVKDEGEDGLFWTVDLHSWFALEAKLSGPVSAMRYREASAPPAQQAGEAEHVCTGDELRCHDGHGCECAMAGNPPPTAAPDQPAQGVPAPQLVRDLVEQCEAMLDAEHQYWNSVTRNPERSAARADAAKARIKSLAAEIRALPAASPAPAAVATVEPTRCDCHPETCCCGGYTLRLNGEAVVSGNRDQLDVIASAVNRANGQSSAPAPAAVPEQIPMPEGYRYNGGGVLGVFDVALWPDVAGILCDDETGLPVLNELGSLKHLPSGYAHAVLVQVEPIAAAPAPEVSS